MKDELSCDFREAEINQLRDALALTTTQRWQWLCQAMDFGFTLARSRAQQGMVTLGAQGNVLWSPEHEQQWIKQAWPPSTA